MPMKNICLEVVNDYFKPTYTIVEFTDNKNNLSYKPIKIIEEIIIGNNVVITYTTSKRREFIDTSTLGIYSSKITDMSHMFSNCHTLDTLHELAEYVENHFEEVCKYLMEGIKDG